MKRIIAFLLCFVFLCGTLPIVASAEENTEFDGIIEINSWEAFKAAFENLPDYAFGNYRMVLMKDLELDTIDREPVKYRDSWISVWIEGNNVEFDFNGHTLSCVDDISNTTSKFIEINVCNFDQTTGSTLRFMDSVGGGGISMISPRVIDDQIAAILVTTGDYYRKVEGVLDYIDENHNKLIIDGGNYTLETSTKKYGGGSTLSQGIKYRGTFIAHNMHTVINDGCFEAKGSGYVYDGVDACTRELTAFGTTRFGNTYDNWQSLVINGGKFESVGYSIHNFDEGVNNINGITGGLDNQLIPEINGGLFAGGIGFIGHTFYTVNHPNTQTIGYSKLAEYQAIMMIKSLSATAILTRENTFIDVTEATFEDLHDASQVLVMNEGMLGLEFSPTAKVGYNTVLYCPIDKSETFSVKFELSDFIKDHVNYTVYLPYVHVRGRGETEWKEYDRVDSKTIEIANYPNGLEVLVGFKIFVARQEFIFTRFYTVNVTEASAPANIITQPESVKAGVGEIADAFVEASNVDTYQWQVMFGDSWVSVDDTVATMLDGVRMGGYNTSSFHIRSTGLGSIKVRCLLTGTDGSTTTSRTVTLTFGDIPQVENFYSHGYYADGDATFYLCGDMFEKVDWTVVYRSGSTTKFYTLEESKAETGIDYDTSLKLFGGVYRAVVTFKNVPESFSGQYSVGYSVSNALGKVNFSLDNVVPFECLPELPTVTETLTGDICNEGGTLTFTFTSPDMTSADWLFESYDEDGIGVVHSIDEMKAAFPKSTFKTELKDGKATLTVTNADVAMNSYTLYAYAVGANGRANAGSIGVSVMEKIVLYEIGDVNADGYVDNLDAAMVLKYDAGLIDLKYEQLISADANGDGYADNLDAAMILKYDAGIIDSL